MRTWEDFVDDMIFRGRTPKQIYTVAKATRWSPFIKEIRRYTKKFKKIQKIFKKRFP